MVLPLEEDNMKKDLKCEMFGGEDGEEQNALMSALYKASDQMDLGKDKNYNMYCFLGQTPKTSLIVELIDALHLIGYKIIKK